METSSRTTRNRLTRMKIGESILKMLEKTPLADISVSKIAQMAGVSRMTFYHYYDTKEKALVDYLAEIVTLYAREAKQMGLEHKFHTRELLEFTFRFFVRYDHFLLRLDRMGCIHLLMDGVNQFLEANYLKHFKVSIYGMYYYAGGLLNVFMKWLRNGQRESVEEVVSVILENSASAVIM